MSSLVPSVEPFAGAAERLVQAWVDIGPLRRRVVGRTAFVTPLGWAVTLLGFVAWFAGVELGWQELQMLAAVCLVVLVLGALFTIGRAELAVRVTLAPARVTVGEPANGQLDIRNGSRRRLLPVPIEVPVGTGFARFDLPSLAREEEHEEAFIVPTQRRAVIPIGPASSVRGDPLGLLRRVVTFGAEVELFVHPRTVVLESLGSGFLRDLEGNETEAISASDLAFHSLRPYVPGDDRRHVHWRTTARLASGDLMVRQFLDTRRSHLVVVLDSAAASYASEEEFELAIEAAASLALRAASDEQDVSVVPGRRNIVRGRGARVLDVFSRVESDERALPLGRVSAYAAERCSDASVVLLTTGSLADPASVRVAASRFGPDAAVLALHAEPGAASRIQVAGGIRRLRLGALEDLARLLRAVTKT